jgi:hypothetical protein
MGHLPLRPDSVSGYSERNFLFDLGGLQIPGILDSMLLRLDNMAKSVTMYTRPAN